MDERGAFGHVEKRTTLNRICLQPDRLRVGSTVLTSQDRREMNLIYPPQTKEEEPEEIVLNLQGFIIQSHLPPITTSSQYVCILPNYRWRVLNTTWKQTRESSSHRTPNSNVVWHRDRRFCQGIARDCQSATDLRDKLRAQRMAALGTTTRKRVSSAHRRESVPLCYGQREYVVRG